MISARIRGFRPGRGGFAAVLAATMAVSACTVGPDFRLPETKDPQALVAQESLKTSSLEMADVTPAVAWWTRFNDPRLDELVSRALANNQDLEAAKERIRQARAATGIQEASLLPNIDGSVSRSRTSDSYQTRSRERGGGHKANPLTGEYPENRQNNYFMGLQAAWELDFWGKNARAVEAAKADVLASEYAYRATVLSLVSETALAYFEILGAEENLDILREEVRNRAEFLNLVKVREENGMASRLDTRRQEVEDANTRAELPAAEARLAVAHYRLATLLGENPQTFTMPEKMLRDYPRLPLMPQGVPIRLARQRPDVLRSEANLRAATARVGVALGDMLPSLKLTAATGYRSGEFEKWLDQYADEWSLGQGVDVPIYDGGRGHANLEANRAKVREAAAMYRQSVLVAFQEIESQIVVAAKNRQRRDALVEASIAATDALRVAREQYRAGLIDLLDYLDSQRVELQARQRVVAADGTLVNDAVTLYRALGGGWSADGIDPVAPIDKSTIQNIAESFPIFAVTLTPEDKQYPVPPTRQPLPSDSTQSTSTQSTPAP